LRRTRAEGYLIVYLCQVYVRNTQRQGILTTGGQTSRSVYDNVLVSVLSSVQGCLSVFYTRSTQRLDIHIIGGQRSRSVYKISWCRSCHLYKVCLYYFYVCCVVVSVADLLDVVVCVVSVAGHPHGVLVVSVAGPPWCTSS